MRQGRPGPGLCLGEFLRQNLDENLQPCFEHAGADIAGGHMDLHRVAVIDPFVPDRVAPEAGHFFLVRGPVIDVNRKDRPKFGMGTDTLVEPGHDAGDLVFRNIEFGRQGHGLRIRQVPALGKGLIWNKVARRPAGQSGGMTEHGHSQAEVEARINAPAGRGHVRDMIYGAIDGSITTFAIVAGVAGAGLSPFIIIALGMANVLADGFSMAAGNYSGTKSELDEMKRLRAVEARHIRDHPDGERREIREILRQKGLKGDVLEEAVTAIAANQKAWIDLMIEGEYGLSAVEPHPMRAALATFAAFLLAGFVPLLPFFLGLAAPFGWSVGLTMAMFFAVGVWKSRWSLAPWWRSGFETFVIGGIAALIAYFVGTLFAV